MSGSSVVLQSGGSQDQAYSLGLDASISSFGVYLQPLGQDQDNWFGFSVQTEAKGAADFERVTHIADDVIGRLQSIATLGIAVFEDYGQISKFAGKLTARAELCGIIKTYLYVERRIPIVMVSPLSLKRYATGNAKAGKDSMILRASFFGFETKVSDEADAFFCARLGADILAGKKTGATYTMLKPD